MYTSTLIIKMYTDFKRSGIIHKIVQNNVIDNLYNFTTALDIVEFIEKNKN